MPTLPNTDAAIFAKLDGSSELSGLGTPPTEIYSYRAHSSAVLPYILFILVDGAPTNEQPRNDLDIVYRVSSFGPSRTVTRAMHQAVFELFHEGSLTIAGWTVYSLKCEGETREAEDTNDESEQVFHYTWDIRLRASED